MFNKVRTFQDAFTFAIAGSACVNGYSAMPITANTVINDAWDKRLSEDNAKRTDTVSEESHSISVLSETTLVNEF